MKKNTRKLKKAALLLCSAVLLVCISIGATVAYLTSTDTVTNTFTVGNVQIKLDETDVDINGVKDGDTRVKANSYKLLPGHTYTKDPMVTVLSGSESCYVKMTVTFTKANELDAIFAPDGGANLISIFKGYDSTNWIAKGNTKDTEKNTRTYEFWYKEAVPATTDNVALDALFDQIVVPGTITNAQLATIEGMTITVNAYAIQADGFADAEAAWGANVNWNA